MLLALTVAEQRFNAVMEVIRDGLTVVEVAEGFGFAARPWTAGCAATERADGHESPPGEFQVITWPRTPAKW